ncbi:helix-turn-helix domain-containing protein [Myceligenerans crystallogenes]|uniref:HTH cro/C1-type domain-containing protein n=1 Tax=Myceligenerans crystallogenes TaxID=316335 RepID=A0ABP4ZP36_9MICO
MQVQTLVDIGALVRGAREDAGLTQAELARRARVSREWLVRFEAGRTNPQLPRILAVLAQLDLVLEVVKEEG